MQKVKTARFWLSKAILAVFALSINGGDDQDRTDYLLNAIQHYNGLNTEFSAVKVGVK